MRKQKRQMQLQRFDALFYPVEDSEKGRKGVMKLPFTAAPPTCALVASYEAPVPLLTVLRLLMWVG